MHDGKMENQNQPLTCQRDHFEVEADVITMMTASKSTLLKSSMEAGRIGVGAKGQPYKINDAASYAGAEDIRSRFAGLIGATSDDIAIHPSAAYGISTAAKNIKPAAGSRILMIEGQFPSNVYAWLHLAKETGAEAVMVPRPEDGDWTRAILDQIDERTSMAALPPCHWTDGSIVDLEPIGAALKAVDATFVIDATQWIGVAKFDVNAIQADYVICAAYKWLLGPYGLSFFYAAPKHQEGRPLEDHLFNHGGVASITGGSGYGMEYTKGARRFDVGQTLNLITLPIIQQSLIQIDAWGADRIGAYLAPITDAIATGVQSLGLNVADTKFRCPHIIGVRKDGGFSDDILDRLQAENVYINARGGALRLSPYLYHDANDAEEVVARIAKVID